MVAENRKILRNIKNVKNRPTGRTEYKVKERYRCVSKFSVKRPYTVIVGVILVIVLGVVSFTRMTTDLLPDMNLPYALVITTVVGASPEEVEADVTAPVEASMATTSSIKNVSSVSYDNYSMVILEYEQSANMDSILIEIQQKLDQRREVFQTASESR